MPRYSPDAAVTVSVFDRLIDTEPTLSHEPAPTRAQSVRQLKEAVRRDLEWLLNTRRVAVPPPDGLREVNRSVYVYGLPDFSAFSLSLAKDQAKLTREIQMAVKTFEPRVAGVRVVPLQPAATGIRVLRFRIEGMLLMDPAPEHISFDTVLELTSGEYEVKNAG